MAYGTMELIQTFTVGSGGTNTIDFTNIPATYNNLVVLASFRSTRNNDEDGIFMTINSSTTGYSWRLSQANGTTASSSSGSDRFIGQMTANNTTASTFTNLYIYIPDYAGNTNKSFSVDNVTEANTTKSYGQLISGLWSNTNAITSLSFQSDSLASLSSKLAQFSTISLYGITNVPSDAKATGGMITEDSSYWYHTFTSSGIFTPKQTINADILVIGGGAAGGWDGGGGGGAGGVIYFANQSLSTSNQTITIGAGGAGGGTTFGNAGSNSSFSALTVGLGGGGGGSGSVNNAKTGGSGGGGGQDGSQPGAASVQANAGATAFYGNSGGQGKTTSGGSGGGGGGAGAAGTSNSNQAGGGNGTNAFSSWGSATSSGQNINGTYYFAGGGGGGTGWGVAGGAGGYGGGGAGGGPNTTQPIAGIANTGGGGGGGNGNPATSASGGSGIVIVRYAK